MYLVILPSTKITTCSHTNIEKKKSHRQFDIRTGPPFSDAYSKGGRVSLLDGGDGVVSINFTC